jgi:hypothetical protein
MRHGLMAAAILCVLGCSSALWAKEQQAVTVSYVIGPHGALPEGLRAVAVINSGVSTQGMQQDEREAKWSVMAADMIEAMLQAGSGLVAQPIMVAKRSETQAVLREHDMALAGLVAGDQAANAGKLLAVQGLITSRIVVQIEEQRGTRSTLDWMSIMGGAMRETLGGRGEPRQPVVAPTPAPAPAPAPRGVQRRQPTQIRRGADGRIYTVERTPGRVVPPPHYRGNPAQIYVPQPRSAFQHERSSAGGGLMIQTREVEEISRSLTVQCSFTLIDVATGQALLQYSPPPFRKQDKRSPDFFFGSLMGEKELDPVDHFIGELVERATQEFVSMLVPVQVSYTYELTARRSAAEAGLRALRADDYAGAIANFQQELAKYPDRHEAMFAIGVTYELMGRHEEALQEYRRALATKGVGDDELRMYTAAKDRLTAHIGRILPPIPPGGFAPGSLGAGPAASAQPPAGPQFATPDAPVMPQVYQPGQHVPAPIVEELPPAGR